MENYIGIDSSKISTAVCIESNKGYFLFNYTNEKENYHWHKKTNHLINYRYFNYTQFDDYSDDEISKLYTYSEISKSFIKDVLEHIDPNEKVNFAFEGYSFSKNPGPIIDLVGISQSLRLKLIENLNNFGRKKIYAPKEVKTTICEVTYGFPPTPINKKTGKPLKVKIVSINKNGLAGGKFEKKDMFEAMLDKKIIHPLNDFYKENYTDILSTKKFPKPFDDINDAIIIKEILKNNWK